MRPDQRFHTQRARCARCARFCTDTHPQDIHTRGGSAMTNHRTSPQDAQAIAAHARQHLECADCGAATGEPCEQPGGRIVCKSRYLAAAIALKRQARATPQTSAQEAERTATLASLPRVS